MSLRKADVVAHRGARASRRAADEGRDGVELLEQLVQVVEPEDFLGDVAFDQHVGAAGVAAVMQHDAVAGIGELGGQRHELVVAAAPAGDQRRPRAAIPDDLIEDVHSADFGDRHGVSPVIMARPTILPRGLMGIINRYGGHSRWVLAGGSSQNPRPAPAVWIGYPRERPPRRRSQSEFGAIRPAACRARGQDRAWAAALAIIDCSDRKPTSPANLAMVSCRSRHLAIAQHDWQVNRTRGAQP